MNKIDFNFYVINVMFQFIVRDFIYSKKVASILT